MTLAELHAALNDFPPALLVASVVFDLWGAAKARETLVSAGYWCLNAGAAMSVLALASGLLAEHRIEQTPTLHRLVENHETLGIGLTLLFVGLAAWRIFRKNTFSQPEQQSYTMAALTGALGMLWLAHLGGTMVYRHGAGIPSDVMQTELQNRADAGSQATER